jgi:superfamily I DNA and RNA helicase
MTKPGLTIEFRRRAAGLHGTGHSSVLLRSAAALHLTEDAARLHVTFKTRDRRLAVAPCTMEYHHDANGSTP